MYEYKMLQIFGSVQIPKKAKRADSIAAEYLEAIVNEQAEDGWEFFRVDEFYVNEKPGFLASIFGAKTEKSKYYVATFRRMLENNVKSDLVNMENK